MNKRTTTLRLLLSLVFILLLLLVLMFGLKLTDVAFNVIEHMETAPLWVKIIWMGLFGTVSIVGGYVLSKLLFRRKKEDKTIAGLKPEDLSEELIAERIAEAEAAGVDATEAYQEIKILKKRRAAGKIYAALYGNISTGKSTLIKALLPDAKIETGVVGGTTDKITTYQWKSSAGDQLVLSDMPGLNEVGGAYDLLSKEEALRAHFVIYLVDGDLTRTQADEVRALISIEKPLIIALNKIDRMAADEVKIIKDRLKEHLVKLGKAKVVAVSSGGMREIPRIMPNGDEEMVMRPIPPVIDELTDAMQTIIDSDQKTLDLLRDTSVFVLAHRKIDTLLMEKRAENADKVIASYSKKAMLGAMAAMAPGTDIIIQGYLATQLIKELSKIYDVSVRKVDMDLLLELIQKQSRKGLTIVLAIAGNGLKSFPGGGTVSGGVLHAIAYGMLFDSLGHAIAKALETRGKLHPVQTATLFKENMSENLGSTAKTLAKIAMAELRKTEKKDK